jgi:hypothetical protein
VAERIPQSVAYLVVFRAFLASDGKTLATGKTIAITISKNGGAFGNPAAGAMNATEISSGFYKFTLDTTDTGTLGPLAWRGAEGTINDAGDVLSVAKATNAGFSALPDAAAEAAGGLYTRGTGAGQINQPGNGLIDANAVQISGDATAADNAEAFFDGTGYAGTNNVIPTVISVTNRVTANTDQIEGADATNTLDARIDARLAAYDPPTHAELVSEVNAVQSDIAALNNLSAAQVNAEVDTALADYDPPTHAELVSEINAVQADIAAISSLDAAGVRAAVGLASANLDTQLDALPTNTELATALAGADDVVLASIAALNNLSAAQVNAEVDTALADYDGPTHAELVSEVNAVQADITALNDLDAAGVRAAVGLAAANLDSQLDPVALLEADQYVDTSVVPWAIVWMARGTGGIGVGTELLRKELADVAGVDLTDVDTVVGQVHD